MKIISIALALMASAATIGASFAVPAGPAQAIPVFDATNYAQNLLQAARALEQINHQLKSLQNEATMLQNMARNLERIDFPELDKLRSAMQRMDDLMGDAQGIDFRIDTLDAKIRALFPGASGERLTKDRRVAEARARLDAATQGYRKAMGAQSQIVEQVREDASLLTDLVEKSQGATGALQAQQAASQLVALSIKQQLQLQQLMATEFRSQAIDRSRKAQAEEDGRAATRRFLGSGKAYPAQRQ